VLIVAVDRTFWFVLSRHSLFHTYVVVLYHLICISVKL